MSDKCSQEGWEYSESAVRELAADLLKGYNEAIDNLR